MIAVAIDGPAGSGKSTIARRVAEALDAEMLDTGAMYRAATFGVLHEGIDLSDTHAVAEHVRQLDIEVGRQVTVDGVDATSEIRGPEVTSAVSVVAAIPEVRDVMVLRQRQWIEERGGGVLEGRDIGTVVLPDAPVKVFLTARPEVRARRRQSDEHASARAVDVDTVAADLERRDRLDSTREAAPLRAADDAWVIDTSDLSIDEVVARILDRVNEATSR